MMSRRSFRVNPYSLLARWLSARLRTKWLWVRIAFLPFLVYNQPFQIYELLLKPLRYIFSKLQMILTRNGKTKTASLKTIATLNKLNKQSYHRKYSRSRQTAITSDDKTNLKQSFFKLNPTRIYIRIQILLHIDNNLS